jgi:hypothetical protein
MNILNTDQKLIPLPTLPGKLAPPIFGPCGARLLIVRLAAYVPAVDGTTGRDSDDGLQHGEDVWQSEQQASHKR